MIATVDVAKFCKEAHKDYLEKQETAYKKLNRLWSVQHYSSKWSDEIRDRFGGLFKTANDTRWFSKYEAITDFLRKLDSNPIIMEEFFSTHQKLIKKANGKKESELARLNDEDIEFLREYIKVMQPLAVTCKLVQGEEGMFWGFHAPLLKKLIDNIEDLSGLKHCEPLKASVLTSIVRRYFNQIIIIYKKIDHFLF